MHTGIAQSNSTRNKTARHNARHYYEPGSIISGAIAASHALARTLKPVTRMEASLKQGQEIRTSQFDFHDEQMCLKLITDLYQLLKMRNPSRLINEPEWTIENSTYEVLVWIMSRWCDEIGPGWTFRYSAKQLKVHARIQHDLIDESRIFGLFFLEHAATKFPEFCRVMTGIAGCMLRLYGLGAWNDFEEEYALGYMAESMEYEDDLEPRQRWTAQLEYYKEGAPQKWHSLITKKAFTPEQALMEMDKYQDIFPCGSFKRVFDAAYYAILHFDGNTVLDFDGVDIPEEDLYNGVPPIMVAEINRYAWYLWDDVWELSEQALNEKHAEGGSAPVVQIFEIDKRNPHVAIKPSEVIKLLFEYLLAGNIACCDYFDKYPTSRVKYMK